MKNEESQYLLNLAQAEFFMVQKFFLNFIRTNFKKSKENFKKLFEKIQKFFKKKEEKTGFF